MARYIKCLDIAELSSIASAVGQGLAVEPMAGDHLEDNLNRAADFNYAGSMMVCVPTSLSQQVGAAPGASRRGTGSRGNRGGRLPERQARDGDALQQGFAGATVKPWR